MELRHPYKETDVNGDIQGKGTNSATTERLGITIATDRRLWNLERNRNIIQSCLAESDDQTHVIIEELYLKNSPTLTLLGVAQQLFISKNTAYRLRNAFFERVAEELGL